MTLHHRPKNTGRKDGAVGVLINNHVKVKSWMVCVNPEITSLESMELVITIRTITVRLSVIYRVPHVKSKNGLKQGTFCNEFNFIYLTILSLERIVILYPTSPSQTLFPILEYFTLHCNVYGPTSSETDIRQSN